MAEVVSFGSRVKHAWNAFFNKDPTMFRQYHGEASYMRPDRVVLRPGVGRSIVNTVYNRIAMDVAAVKIEHIRLDNNGRYIETIDSGLNECLTVSANVDQTGRAFIQDVVMSMFDEGCVAIVPVDTTNDPNITGSYDINTLRTGQIIEWYPSSVRMKVYNELTGKKEEITMPKSAVAIVENPLYSIMNSPNSTLQRLIQKLALLDAIDNAQGSGKLDLIIQLPYVVKSEGRKAQAKQRAMDIEKQLGESKYGIAYTDGTEKITQLNRSVDNNLSKQVEYLTDNLYSQLGLSPTIFDGTADNYYNRTIEPILSAIAGEMKRKFLTKTARTKSQSIGFFSDAFKLVTTSELAELADKLTRNEIMTPNEMRQVLCMKPSEDPQADQLRNRNISAGEDQEFASTRDDGGKENNRINGDYAVLKNLERRAK